MLTRAWCKGKHWENIQLLFMRYHRTFSRNIQVEPEMNDCMQNLWRMRNKRFAATTSIRSTSITEQ